MLDEVHVAENSERMLPGRRDHRSRSFGRWRNRPFRRSRYGFSQLILPGLEQQCAGIPQWYRCSSERSTIDDPRESVSATKNYIHDRPTFIDTVESCVMCSNSGMSHDLIVSGVVKSSINETSLVLIDMAKVLESREKRMSIGNRLLFKRCTSNRG
jgi:hypothetical protein